MSDVLFLLLMLGLTLSVAIECYKATARRPRDE